MTFALILVGTVVGMELVANLMHRFVMHGPLWVLHKSHHANDHARFELNDLFGVFFAIPSIVFIYFGTQGSPVLLAVGIGMAVYGAVYWGFHDVLVHRRIPHGWIPKSGYLRRIVQAHHIHHRSRTKDGAVSFGFLYAPDPDRLKRELRDE